MKLCVFGLGYVGCTSAVCFAAEGHNVVGVDVNPTKVEMINAGRSPMVEIGIRQMLRDAVESRRLRATLDPSQAILDSEISLVCVGTPSRKNGSLNLNHLQRVCEQIGSALKLRGTGHLVVIRSTALPGTVESLVVPSLQKYSGKLAGRDFSVCVNPEFLREGTSVKDFFSPPFTLIGAEDEASSQRVSRLYSKIDARLIITSWKTAEMLKYACNSFHALKISFANEIGNLCKALDIDSHTVMDAFCRDTKLNLSPYYLRPGFAFGGSCLPKDLRALVYRAKETDIELPVLSAVLQSNRQQVERAVQMVLDSGMKRIGVLGISFKSGTDDLRESPMVTLIETLVGKGLEIAIYDPDVSVGHLFGANKEYIDQEIPHISNLMRASMHEVLNHAHLLIIGNSSEEFKLVESKLRENQLVVDLVRLFDKPPARGGYQGICW